MGTKRLEPTEIVDADTRWGIRWKPRLFRSARERPRSGYDAFISYSHAADRELAQVLQRALHAFARPWYRLRALRVFRDVASLEANAGLKSTIENVLLQTKFLILLASPEAAQSEWVAREVDFWCRRKTSTTLLIALTAGEIEWSDDARDFDWQATTALPRILAGRFVEEPLLVDVRWARDFEGLGPRHPELREATATLAAKIHNRPRDALIGDDLRRHRRAIQIAVGAATIIVAFGAIATWQSFAARTQRDHARAQARLAFSRQLAAEATANESERPDLALLLSLEAYRIAPTGEAMSQLLQGLEGPAGGGWQLATFLQHAGEPATALLFSHDGGTILGAESGAFVRWNVATRERGQSSISTDANKVTSMVERPIGGFVAAGDDGAVRWRVGARTTRTIVGDPITRNDLGITTVGVLDPTGRELVQGTDVGEVVVTELATRRWTRRRVTSGEVTSLAVSHDDRLIAAGTDAGGIVLWDRANHQIRWIPPASNIAGDISALAFAPNDHILAAGTLDGTVSLWTSGGRRAGPTIKAAERIGSVAFSHDGQLLAWGDWGGEVDVWNVRRKKLVGSPLHAHTDSIVRALAFAPDDRLLAGAADDGTVALWETARPRLARPMQGRTGHVEAIAFTSGGRLVSTSYDAGGRGTLWSVRNASALESFVPHRLHFPSTAVSHDGRVVALRADNGNAFLYDVRTRRQIGPRIHTGVTDNAAAATASITIGPDDRTFAVPTDGRRIVLGQFGHKAVRVLMGPPDADGAEGIAFSPDGRTLVASYAPSVFSWNLRTGERTRLPITMSADELPALAFSPDSKTLAIGTPAGTLSDGSIVLLRLDGGKPRRRPLARVRFDLWSLAFSPDGRMIAAGTEGGPMLWDVASGAPLGSPLVDGHRADSIAFSPDGLTLASADGLNGGITLWTVGLAAWRRIACKVVARNLSSTEWAQYLGDGPPHKTCVPD